jgi:hypothetical protein
VGIATKAKPMLDPTESKGIAILAVMALAVFFKVRQRRPRMTREERLRQDAKDEGLTEKDDPPRVLREIDAWMARESAADCRMRAAEARLEAEKNDPRRPDLLKAADELDATAIRMDGIVQRFEAASPP